jgi:hypothetical protein
MTDDYWLYVSAPGRENLVYDPDTWGKWLVFVHADENTHLLWEAVESAVLSGKLGPAAEIPEDYPCAGRSVPIVVYTADWRDREDVHRVLLELRRLGFGGRLTYKTDAATLAGKYGTGASTYVSAPGSDDF